MLVVFDDLWKKMEILRLYSSKKKNVTNWLLCNKVTI